MARRAVTLEEVAKAAGVSRATVSRVVNGVASVDRSLREQVEAAISTTGYVPNRAARSLVTRRADAVGLLLPEDDDTFDDPHFARVIRGLMPVLNPLGIHLVLTGAHPGYQHRAVEDIRHNRLDGLVVLHTHDDDPFPGALARDHVPAVLGGRPPLGARITHVDVDHEAGAALAVEALVAAGSTRLATITGPLRSPAGRERLAGFQAAAARHGLPEPLVAEGDFTHVGGARAAEDLAGRHFDGLFVASDLMAVGALTVLRKHGRRVPHDVRVVGFDDSAAASSADPQLTTVRQPVEDMGSTMARLLVSLINDPEREVVSVVFAPELVTRQSCFPAPRP
ncbi:LacI family DNA-binding transcriptional regulator [Actinokineospora bangkokensis]|uniref:Uncharacterized protein n=1 Tax=Actinokineospora bangkokensis TaxID=1193682 RepID=A0A1Q9LLK8_9PSEU|nr:LacI family DNA-binding transcriptional regulator [Actinokineospora bangkokensis]OLR92910.1 hypothetical protein BJP25_18215 [Actinokineospora bangkokensis]